MEIYRGTKITGLKIMEPRIVNHDKPYVYGTTDKVEALIYSVKGGNLVYTNVYGYDNNGKRCLIERKENTLEEVFNCEGRYYVLDDKDFYKHEEIGVGENEYVSEVPVKVKEEVIIPNVLEYFKDLEKDNKLKIYRYPTRPNNYPQDDEDLIEVAIITYYQLNDMDMAFNMLEKYHSELKERIDNAKNIIMNSNKEDVIKNLKYMKED